MWKDYFAQYKAAGWQEYWSRGWCRVEAMLAAVKAVKAGRAALFGGALRTSLLAGRRPHVLFGTKELVRLKGIDWWERQTYQLSGAVDAKRERDIYEQMLVEMATVEPPR